MPERMREVRVFEHIYVCDTAACNGVLLPTGRAGLMKGQMEIACPNCGAKTYTTKRIPGQFSVAKDEPIPPGFQKLMDDINGTGSVIDVSAAKLN